MSNLERRIERLEKLVRTGKIEPDRKTFDEAMDDMLADEKTLDEWLSEHGYSNALEAVAANKVGPKLRAAGKTLATVAESERDTIEEMVCSVVPSGGISLWCHCTRGWCAPINGRLVYLGPQEDYEGALARFRELSGQATS